MNIISTSAHLCVLLSSSKVLAVARMEPIVRRGFEFGLRLGVRVKG